MPQQEVFANHTGMARISIRINGDEIGRIVQIQPLSTLHLILFRKDRVNPMVQNPTILDVLGPYISKNINIISSVSDSLKHRFAHFLLNDIEIENDSHFFPDVRNLIQFFQIPISNNAIIINE